MVFLSLFYLVLVIDFMVLNCYYYVYVRGDPSLAGRFDINNHAAMDVFLSPVIATLLILTVYYAQYTVGL